MKKDVDRFFGVSPIYSKLWLKKGTAEPHGSAGSVADLRTGGCCFDFQLGQYSFRGLMSVIATGFIPLSTTVRCFDNGYVGK